MDGGVATTSSHAQRVDELGQIIRAYSEVTDRLQQSHDQLQRTVQTLRLELSEKNRLLERRNRLAALGEMAAGIAHEIRNPLGGIQLYASMLCKDLVELPSSLELVKKISSGVKRMDGLLGQVLQFTREINAHPVETDLAAIVAQSIDLMNGRLERGRIRCDAAGSRPLICRADPLLIGQALLNLLINAAEALDADGNGHGGTHGDAAASGMEAKHPGDSLMTSDRTITVRWAPEGTGGARLSVADNGPGIPPAALDRIFDLFFTTKENGTGLGLAIVHRIIEAHDGSITVTSPPGGGTAFEVRL